MIALSLTAVVLTFLFSFFVESARIEKKLDKARTAVINRGFMQTRLQTILSAIDTGTNKPYLYTQQFEKEESISLVILFNNGIDPDPAYSGSIIGRFFLDKEKNLCFATWPLDKLKQQPWRKEILLPCVESFEFEFLGKKTATEANKKEEIRPINDTIAWRTQWPKIQSGVPSIIRLKVHEKNGKEPLLFAFILPSLEPLVTYLERGAI